MQQLILFIGFAALTLMSCLHSKVENSTKKDSIAVNLAEKKVATGSDRDEHGCIGSAGYTWSVLKNECIRVFEQDVQLTQKESKESYTSLAAVVFNADKSKAEVFLANGNPDILEQTANKKGSMRWKKGNYELIEEGGFSLLENGKVIYYQTQPNSQKTK